MSELHFNLISGLGLCNSIYSLQLALFLSRVTKRKLFLYNFEEKFFNSKKYNLFDFIELKDSSIEIIENKECQDEIKELPFSLNLPKIGLYYKEFPDQDYLLNKDKIFDLSDLPNVRFKSCSKTVNFYSYLFCLNKELYRDTIEYIKYNISIKPEFNKKASLSINFEKEFNCVSIRRGDFLTTKVLRDNFLNFSFEVKDFLPILKNNFRVNDPLLVLSDELDINFFSEIKKHYINSSFFNIKCLEDGYEDQSLVGLLGIIAALKSNCFIGTMGSTYSSFIQQSRVLNNKKEDFRFLYSQRPYITLDEFGKCIEYNNNKYSWNRVLKPEHKLVNDYDRVYWPLLREWPECGCK